MPTEMKSYKQYLEALPILLKAEVEKEGICKFTTCNTSAYGWDENKHDAMMHLQRKGVEGLHIAVNYKFKCWDWTITEA